MDKDKVLAIFQGSIGGIIIGATLNLLFFQACCSDPKTKSPNQKIITAPIDTCSPETN